MIQNKIEVLATEFLILSGNVQKLNGKLGRHFKKQIYGQKYFCNDIPAILNRYTMQGVYRLLSIDITMSGMTPYCTAPQAVKLFT